jgi:DNA-binding transcriptional MocR family regulator
MRFRIDRQSDAPVNQQIADQVRSEVAAGRLGTGDRLPPIRDLARDLGVHRDTVASAYERLAADGVVESTVGRGTFIAGAAGANGNGAERIEPPLSPLVERVLAWEGALPRFGDVSGAIPLHALVPEPGLYPVDAFRRALNTVVSAAGPQILGYGAPQGQPALRAALAERLGQAGIEATADELVLCHGSSQGIALALRLFAGPGDAIAVEETTYHNVLATLYSLGLRPVAVPIDENGPDLEALERTLARPEVKAFYTIPTFHNPLGITTSLGHRRALLQIAARAGKPVVEDAFQLDLGGNAKLAPPLAGLDAHGLVVQLGSFSKTLFPGARVGWILARGRKVQALVALKRASDLSDSMPLQSALAEFVASGAYDRHLIVLRRIVARRRKALLAALESEMPAGARWTRPEGGYQVWLELPGGLDSAELLPEAARRGVLYAPGQQFSLDGRPSSGLRLTVAMADEAAAARGVAILAGLVRERLQASPRLADAGNIHV